MPRLNLSVVLFWHVIATLPWLPQLLAAERPDYKVEMILFAHQDHPNSQTEAWDGRLIQPNVSNAINLAYGSTPAGFVTLAADTKDLMDVVARLNASPRYRVIKHLVWRQPGLDKASARPVHIQGGTDYSMQFAGRMGLVKIAPSVEPTGESVSGNRLLEVDGTVTVVLGRYLHVYTDLVYRQPISTPTSTEDELPPSTGDESSPSTEEGIPQNSTVLADFQIKNRRRMRSRELHYLDHPRFGILVQITPLDEES